MDRGDFAPPVQAGGLSLYFQIEFSLSLSQIKRWFPLYGLLLAVACGYGCGDIKRFSYEGFGRDGWQMPDKVIRSLKLDGGDRVADLGAGGGYFTFRLADAVGGGGKVYAADIDSNMIEHLQQRARDEGYPNVEAVRGEVDDPLLPEKKSTSSSPVILTITCRSGLPTLRASRSIFGPEAVLPSSSSTGRDGFKGCSNTRRRPR